MTAVPPHEVPPDEVVVDEVVPNEEVPHEVVRAWFEMTTLLLPEPPA